MGFFSGFKALVSNNPLVIYRSGMAIASLFDVVKRERSGEIRVAELGIESVEIIAEVAPDFGVTVIDDAFTSVGVSRKVALSKLRQIQSTSPTLGRSAREKIMGG